MIGVAHTVGVNLWLRNDPFLVDEYVALGRFVGKGLDLIGVAERKASEETFGTEGFVYFGRNADGEDSAFL